MKRYAAGYLRRSSADAANPGAMSREVQERAVHGQASIDGTTDDLRLFVDWGISGKRADRPAYQQLCQAIVAGEVSHVYGLNLSRLGRTVAGLLAFVELCKDNGTVLKLSEDSINTATSSGRMLLTVLASVAQFTQEVAAEAQLAALAERKRRGDVLGAPPYGHQLVEQAGRYVLAPDPSQPLAPLRQALDDAGSVAGAVRLLNERQVPAPYGDTWHLFTFRRIVEREWPGLLATRRRRKPRKTSDMRLAGLLRCHCGTTLTPNAARRQYYCSRSKVVEPHGKGTIAESRLLPWLQDEAAHLRPVSEVLVATGNPYDDSAERSAVEQLRGKVADTTVDAALAELDAKRAAAGAQALALAQVPPAVEWEAWQPGDVNSVLRAMWEHVQLDEQLLPVAATWRVPEWRR